MLKKLFPALAALRAIATHPNLSINDVKTFGFGDIFLYITVYWILKFDNLTAAKTYQVVVFMGCLNFIMVVVFTEMNFLY